MAVSGVMTTMQVLQNVANFSRENAGMAQHNANQLQQAQSFENQAVLKEQEIKKREMEKNQELLQIQQSYAQDKGKSRLLAAAGGVDVASGSALDVLLDNTARAKAESYQTKKKASFDKRALQYQAGALRTDAYNARLGAGDRRSGLEKGLATYDVLSPLLSSVK